MKRIFTLVSVLVILCMAASCKKDPVGRGVLQNYADKVKIYPLKVYGHHAVLSFVETFPDPSIAAIIEVQKEGDTGWRNIPYSDKNDIPVSDLNANTLYKARVTLSMAGEVRYAPVVSFTTRAFDINYARFFDGNPALFDQANGLFSVEGAQHAVYGSGFLNVTAIKVILTEVDNPSEKVMIDATVLSDSILTFEIPRNLVGNEPYQRNKIYNCMIGDVPLIGYSSYSSGNLRVTGDLIVLNRDIEINKFSVTASICPIISFEGLFGPHKENSVCPPYLYGLFLWTEERELIIRSGGSIIKNIRMDPMLSAVCDGDGLAAANPFAISKKMLAYHEVTALVIRTTLARGAYTAQVRQSTQDGKEYFSNEFPFAL